MRFARTINATVAVRTSVDPPSVETYPRVFEVRMVQAKAGATIDDLYRVRGKAEIIDGELVLMSPTGFLHGRVAGAIYRSLTDYEKATGTGYAIPDNVGFVVNLPNRRSFSPDAAFYVGEPIASKFLEGAPRFAAEVRSEEDYGPSAEVRMAAKRADYFAAGTLVVWDVDGLRGEWVRSYAAERPDAPREFGRAEVADAEPALPGWRIPVDHLFDGSRRARETR
jgi:Uma2 family endonuclease